VIFLKQYSEFYALNDSDGTELSDGDSGQQIKNLKAKASC